MQLRREVQIHVHVEIAKRLNKAARVEIQNEVVQAMLRSCPNFSDGDVRQLVDEELNTVSALFKDHCWKEGGQQP